MNRASLAAPLQHPDIRCGSDCARVVTPSLPTGFAELDVRLPGGGWPTGALTEIYAGRQGVGELRLTMPAAARVTQQDRWLAMIAPPHVSYAPALAVHGVQLSRLLAIRPQSGGEKLWACEQALRSGSCSMVLFWPDRIDERDLRRLQLAAEMGGAAGFLFYGGHAAQSSPAALRLAISGRGSRTAVRILKRRGGDIPAPVTLDLFASTAALRAIRPTLNAIAPRAIEARP